MRWIKIIMCGVFPSVLLGLALSLALLFQMPVLQQFSSENVKVFAPLPGEVVTSPLRVTGEARGNWFFEASFPIKIYDGNGKELGIAVAQAQDEWMTTEFVPFAAMLEFKKASTQGGKIVFQKDNPSGLPEYDAEESFPIVFSSYGGAETARVKAYFSNNRLDPEVSCTKVFPVEREIVKTQSVGRAALQELLSGVRESEKELGFFTNINPGVEIQRLTIEDGEARVDFDDTLEAGVGGSCRVSAIRAQITDTLKQFSSVNNVIISINGRSEDILQP